MAEDIHTGMAGTVEADPVTKVLYVGPSISWRAIFAGAFVGLLVFLALGMLGIALGGISLKSMVQRGSGGEVFTVALGIWTIFSAIVSLFVGGYVAGRTSGVLPTRIGAIEGLVVASMVLLLAFGTLGMGIGALGGMAGSAAGATVGAVGDVAGNQQVQDVLGRTLNGLNLRSSPKQVAAGLATRMVSGDEQGAVNYLAYQASITTDEANRRIANARTQLVGVMKNVGTTTGNVIQALGWTFFLTIVLGSFFALVGGVLGVRRNIRHPLTERDKRLAMESRAEWYRYPYAPVGPEAHST